MLRSEPGSVQLLSHVWLFETPWTVAHQVSLSLTNSQSLLKFITIESVMPSNHLSSITPFSSCFQSFPGSGLLQWVSSLRQVAKVMDFHLQHQSFQWIFRTDPLGLTGLIFLQSEELSRVFSNATIKKHQFFNTQLSLGSISHIHTRLLEKTISLTRGTFVNKVMSLLFNMLSRLVKVFLPRNSVF